MGNNSSAVHPNDKPKYTVGKVEKRGNGRKKGGEEESRQPLTKEQQSQTLSKDGNRRPREGIRRVWLSTRILMSRMVGMTRKYPKIRPRHCRSSMKQMNASGTLAIDLIKQLHANLNESSVLQHDMI